MQFRRKKSDQNGRKNGLRVAILLGGIALILLFFHLYEDDNDSPTDNFVMLQGESPDNAPIIREQQQQEVNPNGKTMPRLSLLNSPDAIKNLPACEAVRHDLLITTNGKFDNSHPAIFSGWNPPCYSKMGQ